MTKNITDLPDVLSRGNLPNTAIPYSGNETLRYLRKAQEERRLTWSGTLMYYANKCLYLVPPAGRNDNDTSVPPSGVCITQAHELCAVNPYISLCSPLPGKRHKALTMEEASSVLVRMQRISECYGPRKLTKILISEGAFIP